MNAVNRFFFPLVTLDCHLTFLLIVLPNCLKISPSTRFQYFIFFNGVGLKLNTIPPITEMGILK